MQLKPIVSFLGQLVLVAVPGVAAVLSIYYGWMEPLIDAQFRKDRAVAESLRVAADEIRTLDLRVDRLEAVEARVVVRGEEQEGTEETEGWQGLEGDLPVTGSAAEAGLGLLFPPAAREGAEGAGAR